MAFTVAADYFLILRNENLVGVAVFCFAHFFYICRARAQVKPLHAGWVAGMLALAGAVVYLVARGNLYGLASLYAILFFINLFSHILLRQHINNARMVIIGLVFFVLCDINVLLFNIPRYVGVFPSLARVYPFIWIFYLPAQLLLALSAVRWRVLKRSDSYGTI